MRHQDLTLISELEKVPCILKVGHAYHIANSRIPANKTFSLKFTNCAALKSCYLIKFRQIITKMLKYMSSVNFKILLQGFLLLRLVKDRSVRAL